MDRMGFDVQMIFPSTLYAHMTNDPEFEAALYRAYNRYVAKQCARARSGSNGRACCRCASRARH